MSSCSVQAESKSRIRFPSLIFACMSKHDQASFRRKLLEWYHPAQRALPWKHSQDAYKIWLSEIILQQTRVEQGTPYYLAFVKKYPNVRSLANAPLDEVLKLWEGLGYYSRARNLHAAAQQILRDHRGKFPSAYAEIRQLKGIGNYTAAAIASFAFGLPHAVLDGNVYRVLSRVFGIETPIDSTEGKKQFEVLAEQLLDRNDPATYNQAIMDFGSLVCKPRNPLCHTCPLSSECKARELDKVELLPVKAKKLIRSERHFHYIVAYDDTHILIRQRDAQDIWKGLFEFPMEEKVNGQWSMVNSKLYKTMIGKQAIGSPSTMRGQTFSYRQTLSHQYINGYFYEVRFKKLPGPPSSFLKIHKTELEKYAFPKIVRAYLQDRLNFLS